MSAQGILGIAEVGCVVTVVVVGGGGGDGGGNDGCVRVVCVGAWVRVVCVGACAVTPRTTPVVALVMQNDLPMIIH